MWTFSCKCGATTREDIRWPPPCVGCPVCGTSLIAYGAEDAQTWQPLDAHQWAPIDRDDPESARACRVCGLKAV